MDIILGKERRLWSDADKRQIVLETFTSGATCLAVARRHQVSTSMVFCWRKKLRAELGFPEAAAPVRFAPLALIGDSAPPAQCALGAIIDIDLGGAGRVKISGAAGGELVVAILKALTRR